MKDKIFRMLLVLFIFEALAIVVLGLPISIIYCHGDNDCIKSAITPHSYVLLFSLVTLFVALCVGYFKTIIKAIKEFVKTGQ